MGLLTGINPWARPRNNYAATTTPAVTDDSGDGYSIGSTWIDLVTDTVYKCTDATVGSAVWVRQGSATAPDVVAAAVLTDNALVRGDGGVRGVQTTAWVCADTTNALSLAGLEMQLNPASGFGLTLTQTLKNAATPNPLLTLTGAAHTAVTASAEASDVFVNLARTVQWATGALATQRAVRIAAPTYAFVGASTLAAATTVHIAGAPQAGTNATITTPSALWIELATGLTDRGIRITEDNVVRTSPMLSMTRQALATGAMIDLTPGAATTAAIATRGGKIDLSIAGDVGEYIYSNADGSVAIGYGSANVLTIGSGTTQFFTQAKFGDALAILIGTGNDVSLFYSTAQSPDALVLGLSADSNHMVVCRKADVAYDFAHGTPSTAQTNPTFFFHDSSQSTTNWTSISHGVIATGAGDLLLSPVAGAYVKFGTKAGTGDVAVDGYVSIKDAAGNVVKLATVA